MESFKQITRECRRPSPDVLRRALEKRSLFTTEESDFLVYLAGYTHYKEARDVLKETKLMFLDEPGLTYDLENRAIHFKVLISDLTLKMSGLSIPFVSAWHGISKHENLIKYKVDNSFIENFGEYDNDLPKSERGKMLASLEFGLHEEVIASSKQSRALGNIRLVFHFARIPARNIAVNLERLFCNVSSVIAVNHPDQMFNLSVERLRQASHVRQALTSCKWYVVEDSSAQPLIDFLVEIGAPYALIQFKVGLSDYTSELIADLEERALNAIAKFSGTI
jgi:hypothetical protein